MKSPSEQDIRNFIVANGAVSSSDVMKAFGVSKPTAIKLLNKLACVAIGNSVSRSYTLPKPVGAVGSQWNLYRVDESENVERIGVLRSTSAGFYLDGDYPAFFGDEFKNKIFPSLPWFLFEHRPQGFVGRNIVYNLNKTFGISKELKSWGDSDILEYAVRFGGDLAGSLILGETAKSAFLAGNNFFIPESRREDEYPELALNAVSNGVPRSSAAGEQPKFCTTVQGKNGEFRNVIVKFSGETTNDINCRWADLLIAEYTALQVLKKYGFPASKAELVFAKNRVFLEYSRIDRVGRYGRRGTSSLSGIDSAFIGAGGGPWAQAMRKGEAYFRAEDIELSERIYDFGLAVGNTDMHFGNISFYVEHDLPFALAPIYDMLPMFYAPLSDGTLRNEPLQSIPPTKESREMAKNFWKSIAANANVSASFRRIANSNL